MSAEQPLAANPYVGPSTFKTRQAHLFFGREREARDLLARVVSERLLLFYAQSGAGKSSLLNTRLIPQLAEKGFIVLPVGRVGGDLPAGVADVDNVFAFNLMSSIDEGKDPQRLARISLCDFLARLTRKPLAGPDGQEHKGWVYDPAVTPTPRPANPSARRFSLIVDQFEEIVTAHPASWQEREGFFAQLDDVMRAFPNLWVTLTLREDYVAALDPYAPLVADRLRGRFYMERMGAEAALQAVREPAALAGRPFAAGVAEKLVDDLRQVSVPGQPQTVAGQYVEPMQLQVVCYQLWETLEKRGSRTPELTGIPEISYEDLAEAGDVNKALLQFYDETIKAALASPEAAGITENELRSWFETELITEAGTRGFVHRGKEKTGGLPNAVVGLLQNRFLVRVEERSGGAWVELVHDRFVEPIRSSNGAWFAANRDVLQSVLQRQAASWDHAGRPEGMLLEGEALLEAERWAQAQHTPLEPHEQAFLDACRESSLRRVEYERQRNRRMQVLTTIATAVALLALVGFALAAIQSRLAMASSRQALGAQSTAVSEAAIRATAQIDAVSQAAAAATAESIARSEAEAAAAALAKAEAQATIATENKNSAEAALALFATQQAALQRTPTPAPAAGPAARTPKPGGTATVAAGVAAERTVQAIQAQLAQSAAKQEALAATPARAQLSQLYAVVEGFPAAIYSKPDYNSQQVASIVPPARVPALDVQNVGDVYWIQVQTDKGEVGWLEGGVFTYEGDRNWLPAPLRIMMTGRQGVVVSYNDQQTYRLVNRPQGGRPVGPEFPVGTGITILATERGDTTYGSGRWYLVLLISPERRLRGYLPVEAVQEVQSTTN